MPHFKEKRPNTICVIGLGLIGGSCALEIKTRNLAHHILGYDKYEKNCQEAESLGIVDQAFFSWNDALAEASIVILAVPVRSMIPVFQQIHPYLSPQTIVTDVGSVKAPILQFMNQIPVKNFHFVAGHPIAGSEAFGPGSARLGLFAKKKFILCPDDTTDHDALQQIRFLWEQLESVVYEMEAEQHDFIFSEVSHLPHILAYASISAIGQSGCPESLEYFGAGLKDFSRIAASSPEMWADIFLENPHLLKSIQRFQTILEAMETAIHNQDRQSLIEQLNYSKTLRDQWITNKQD